MNTNKKPSGVMKGSGTMAVKGDKKGAPASRKINNVGQKLNSQYFGSSKPKNGTLTPKLAKPSAVKAMVKVMKAYPNGSNPSASKTVINNRSTKDGGKSMKYLPR